MKTLEGNIVWRGCELYQVSFVHNQTNFNSWHNYCPPLSLLGCYTVSTAKSFFI